MFRPISPSAHPGHDLAGVGVGQIHGIFRNAAQASRISGGGNRYATVRKGNPPELQAQQIIPIHDVNPITEGPITKLQFSRHPLF